MADPWPVTGTGRSGQERQNGDSFPAALTRYLLPHEKRILATRKHPALRHATIPGTYRLRVSVSDSAMSETTTLLKAGATDLVLRMAEAGTVLPADPASA
ncbi:MAG: proteasome accessory factor PafA2 family protein [Streptosporangiaceae bacterium]